MTNKFPTAERLCSILNDIVYDRINLKAAQDQKEDLNNQFPYIAPNVKISFEQLKDYNSNLSEIKDVESTINKLEASLEKNISAVRQLIPDGFSDRTFTAYDDRFRYEFRFENDDLKIHYEKRNQ